MKKYRSKLDKGFILPLIFSLLLIISLVKGVDMVEQSAKTQQKQSLEKAIHQAIISCYALEGYYPESLSYLKEHYGISYDNTQFFVDYQPIGENIFPSVTVIER